MAAPTTGSTQVSLARLAVTVGAVPVAYWRATPKLGSAAKVLLLHGVGASSHIWEPLGTLLGETCDLIAVDFPGMGGSAAKGVLTPIQLATFTADFLEALAIPRVEVVVGHSLGGTVALELALSAPSRLSGVMVLNAAPALPLVPRLALKTPIGKRLSRMPMGPEGASRTLARIYLSWIFGDARKVTPEVVDGYVNLTRSPGFNDRMADQMEGLARHRRRLADLRSIGVPVSVVWGSRDPLFKAEQGVRLAGAIPHAALHRLPTVGHCAAQEDPETVAALIRELLSRIGRRAA